MYFPLVMAKQFYSNLRDFKIIQPSFRLFLLYDHSLDNKRQKNLGEITPS